VTAMIDQVKIGERLRQVRENRSMTAAQVARICDLNKNTIYQIEEGNQDMKLQKHLVPICRCYRITVQLLIASVEITESQQV